MKNFTELFALLAATGAATKLYAQRRLASDITIPDIERCEVGSTWNPKTCACV